MKHALYFFGIISFFCHLARAEMVSVPLSEKARPPAIDLTENGVPLDPGLVYQRVLNGVDTSHLEPKLSNLYLRESLPIGNSNDSDYPDSQQILHFDSELPGIAGLVRAKVFVENKQDTPFNLSFSLDSHAALSRAALFRKLGYAIPEPKHYKTLKIKFPSLEQRDSFMNTVADGTLTERARWLAKGKEALTNESLIIEFQDVVLEKSLITVPPLHWGILTSDAIASRRSIRALIVPLTLLDISESVNLYSQEPIKISNDSVIFSRMMADAFENEVSIGDVKWIANKIARLTRDDWRRILSAGIYPPDIEALLIEKTLGRVNQMMRLLRVPSFREHTFDLYLTYGNVLHGKALQEKYPGYAARFTYGDPESPLRPSELIRFFGINGINGAITSALTYAGKYLQVLTPDRYLTAHQDKMIERITEHMRTNPRDPYIQPIEIWGGPTAGATVNASRNIVAGTYYGSENQIQLVDALSAGVQLGGFFALSGVPLVGVSSSPSVQMSRSYVHVRPLGSIQSAWKDKWKNIAVPHFMNKLARILSNTEEPSDQAAVKAFLEGMSTGEMFIITDGITGSAGVTGQIPLGAILGIIPSFGQISAGGSIGGNYGLLSRTTITRTATGFQIYLNRIHSRSFEMELNASFIMKLLSANENFYSGQAQTEAFLFEDSIEDEIKLKSFRSDVSLLLRRNHPEPLREDFEAFQLQHTANGNRFKFLAGPLSWVRRMHLHKIEVSPPSGPSRTVIEGTLSTIGGSDWYGFLGSFVRAIKPLINFATKAVGDDPSTNFLGKSKSLIVNSQIEITEGRENNTIVKIQEAYAGWSMRKARLLRIIRRIKDELSQVTLGSEIVNEDEFAQTKKVQAYNIAWSLIVYEKGINHLMKLLNPDETSTRRAQNILIYLMGQDEYREYCHSNNLPVGISTGPITLDINNELPGVPDYSNGQISYISCVTPWMKEIYALRDRASKRQELFTSAIHDEEIAKERVRSLNQLFGRLSKHLPIGTLIKLVGTENSFFQLKVSGFRTKDENGDSQYFSNTLGQVDETVLAGPLSDIQNATNISSNEIEARYLSNGF